MTSLLFLDCVDDNLPGWVLIGIRIGIAFCALLYPYLLITVERDYRMILREIEKARKEAD